MSDWREYDPVGVAGYTAVSLAGVFVLFAKKKKYTVLKAGFVLLNSFLLLPFAGHVLNGFSYVSNRWIWAYGMLIAYIFVKIYPELVFAYSQRKAEGIRDASGLLCSGTSSGSSENAEKPYGNDPSDTFRVYRTFLWKYFCERTKSLSDDRRLSDRRYFV